MIIAARLRGWDVAASNLEHFLDATGTDVIIDKTWLLGFDRITDAVNVNIRRFENELRERLNNKYCGEFSDYWDRALTGSLASELYYASGTSTITSTGKFVFDKSGHVIGSVTHKWWDPYDWHAGLGAFIPGFGAVSDSDAIRLKDAGRAAEFNMTSSWTQKVIYDISSHKFIWSTP